ncbi:MAG: hypothetical protein HY718_18540 [Planctomycetes bacterium]|nr:hypothetical protein [Planctomycetota bacterium]
MLVAMDLEGSVHNVAVCDGGPEGVDAPGWPIRASILRLHSWLAAPVSGDRWSVLIGEVKELAARGVIDLGSTMVVMLGVVGRGDACRLAEALGARAVCIPRHRYVISPRGIVAAGGFRDYSRRLSRPEPVDLHVMREAFVGMMDQAADDVQAVRLEQDDSILDRYAEVSEAEGQGAVMVPVESLSDADWLMSRIQRVVEERWGRRPADDAVEIVSLHLRCAIELPGMFPARLPPTDERIERALIRWVERDPVSDPVSQTADRVYDRSRLLAGDRGRGPVRIVEPDVVVDIGSQWRWQVTEYGHLACRRDRA